MRAPARASLGLVAVLGTMSVQTCLSGLPVAAAAPAPAGEGAREQAAAAVKAGARAFEAGDHARALAEFERALALRPAPKLHFNIGACHEQLMLAARTRGDAAAESTHRAAAVEAFRAYLREKPEAEDWGEVAARVIALGGSPLTPTQLKPIPPPRSEPAGATPGPAEEFPPPPVPVEGAPAAPPAEPPAEPYAEATPGPAGEAAPTAGSPEPAPIRPRGRFGGAFGLLAAPQLDATRLDGAWQGSLAVRLGGFVGARRRVYLGGSGLLAAAGTSDAARLGLHTQAVTADVEYAHPVGRAKRVGLVVGGFLVGAREVLRARAGQDAGTCAAGAKVASQRGGGGAGGRLGLLVLLGARQNHELGVRLSSAVLGFGKGTASCEPRPFADLDVPRTRLVVHVDTGYSFRF